MSRTSSQHGARILVRMVLQMERMMKRFESVHCSAARRDRWPPPSAGAVHCKTTRITITAAVMARFLIGNSFDAIHHAAMLMRTISDESNRCVAARVTPSEPLQAIILSTSSRQRRHSLFLLTLPVDSPKIDTRATNTSHDSFICISRWKTLGAAHRKKR